MYKGVLFLLSLLVFPCWANDFCSHRDASWEHRVTEDGNLDVATKMLDSRTRVYIGGSPGKLQVIKLDGVGKNIKTEELKTKPPVKNAFITIGSDVYKRDRIPGIYFQDSGGSITIPMRGLLQYVLRSKSLHISIETNDNRTLEYDIDVRDIPIGIVHDC